MKKAGLHIEQARELLKCVGDVLILNVNRMTSINDVFKVITRSHGNFYIKFHTARWYADQPDTFFVVEREAAVHELLRKREMPLPYKVWVDTSKTVVPRSVLICEELSGISVTEAIAKFPQDVDAILKSLGCYLRRLHEIEFSKPGLLGPQHAQLAELDSPIPPVEAWDEHEMHHPEHFQRAALSMLNQSEEKGLLPADVAIALKQLFQFIAAAIQSDYIPPRFTVGNCHAWHFHVERSMGKWIVLGFYDFEAVSAGDSTIDLIELEMTLTPNMRSFAWRKPFFDGYGTRPDFEGYKMRLLYYILYELEKGTINRWMEDHWIRLIQAEEWDELTWYPVHSR
jgi:aminoglycoside phosphotransferase